MSKSKGNVTSPQEVMKNHGAEILRLWVVSEDYRDDVSFSSESLQRVSESYRKIRNTSRFILGNLYDFNPDTDSVPVARLGDLDRWALSRAAGIFKGILQAYERYEFHAVYQRVMNFCAVDLSAVYFDILKDRLYTAAKNSTERRSSQTVLWEIGSALARSLAPVLSFTSEECWNFLPKFKDKTSSIFLAGLPEEEALTRLENPVLEEKFETVWRARDTTFKVLEDARQNKVIGHPREAKVTLTVDSLYRTALESIHEDLARIFLVSELELVSGAELRGFVSRAGGEKCARCWVFSKSVGRSSEYRDLCERCVEAVK